MSEIYSKTNLPIIEPSPTEDFLQDFISFIRSRLNVIGTSLYLLEEAIKYEPYKGEKYIQKIYEEIDLIRNVINQ